MKKVLSIALLVVLLLTVATAVHAESFNDKLYSYMSGNFELCGKEVKIFTNQELGQVRQYLETHTISEEQYNNIKSQIDDTIKIMNNAKVTNIKQLKATDRENAKKNIENAASTLKLKLKYVAADDEVLVLDENNEVVGKIPVGTNRGNQVQTDIVHYEYLAIPVVAIIAVAMFVVYKKSGANA